MLSGILFLFFLVFLSAIFSMAEMSLAASRKVKLQILVDANNKNAAKILRLQEKPGRFFTAIQIAVNIIAILSGLISDTVLNKPLVKLFQSSVFQKLGLDSYAEICSSITSFLLVTALIIEFADLIPKRIAMIYPEKIALALVTPMIFLVKFFSPIIMLFDEISNFMLKVFRVPHVRNELMTHAEIVAVMDAGAEAGIVDKKEHHLIENVFELESRWVTSAMTLRDEITYFTLHDNEQTIREKIAKNPQSKYLMCEKKIDSVIGYVDAKNILTDIVKNEQNNCLSDIQKVCNKNLLIIPNTLTLSEVLDKFNEKCENFAVILNEYAHVVGIITLNDVMTTLLGDVVAPLQDDLIIKRSETSWLIDGTTPIEDVAKALKINDFPEEDSYETLAGFLMYMLKAIPKKAAIVEYEGFQFEVMDVDNYKIDQVLINFIGKPQPENEDDLI
ncbi:MAG: hemolysin family protein [Treponemataceae bacterium]